MHMVGNLFRWARQDTVLSMLGDNRLFYVLLLHSFVFFSSFVSHEFGLLYIWELFCFLFCQLRTEEIIYAVCTFDQGPWRFDSGVWFCLSGRIVVWTV